MPNATASNVRIEGTRQGQPHPQVQGLFWDIAKGQWVRNPEQKHAGVAWQGGPAPTAEPAK